VDPPQWFDRRKHKRVRTQNLISYFSFAQTGKMISQGMGVAMDISKGGMLLETPDSIKPGLIVLAATDREKNLFEVRGKLAYSQKTSIGTYLSGIEFIGVNERVLKFITKLIQEYNYQGYNLFIAIAQKIQKLNTKTPIPCKAGDTPGSNHKIPQSSAIS